MAPHLAAPMWDPTRFIHMPIKATIILLPSLNPARTQPSCAIPSIGHDCANLYRKKMISSLLRRMRLQGKVWRQRSEIGRNTVLNAVWDFVEKTMVRSTIGFYEP